MEVLANVMVVIFLKYINVSIIMHLTSTKYYYICQLYLNKTLASWKRIYDKTRQHMKKQRFHFANKGPYSQSYGFSSSHVWM